MATYWRLNVNVSSAWFLPSQLFCTHGHGRGDDRFLLQQWQVIGDVSITTSSPPGKEGIPTQESCRGPNTWCSTQTRWQQQQFLNAHMHSLGKEDTTRRVHRGGTWEQSEQAEVVGAWHCSNKGVRWLSLPKKLWWACLNNSGDLWGKEPATQG